MEEKKIWAVKDGYLVHRDGSIYKLNWKRTGTMRKVKQSVNNYGYLCFNCHGKLTLSHRFVAECFIPNPDNLPQINHKNEIRNDNRAENLEWCDNKYNSNYGTRNERVAESLSRKVLQFTKGGEFVKEWNSTKEIERQLGFLNQAISACCNGNKYRKSAYDFIWRYSDNNQQETF